MELKSPKAKKKSSISRLISWSKMFRTPILILLLLGTTTCDEESSDDLEYVPTTDNRHLKQELKIRHGHILIQPNNTLKNSERQILSDIKYLRRHLNKEIVNFVMTDSLVDGEMENRVHFNGITAKETSVGGDGSDSETDYSMVQNSTHSKQPPTKQKKQAATKRKGADTAVTPGSKPRYGLKLRQLSDGRHLVQVIYTPDGDIQDCEFIPQGRTTRNFLKTLRKELKLALDEETYRILQRDSNNHDDEKYYRHFGNVTFRLLKNGDPLPQDVASWLDYDKLKMECMSRHEEMKFMVENRNKVNENSLARSRRSLRENFIVPGTKWCGAGQLAKKYNELGHDKKEDRCCRAHDNCKVNIGAFKRRFGYMNFRPFTVSHCKCDRRRKRDAAELLRVPGTKWCGKGYSATRYAQLGAHSKADRCCRAHDLRCPFWIGALEKKYGIYNWRINTLMHCRCDKRFRACLKLADTSVSNMVGKLFFNVVQTKCFVLKPVKTCTQRSWWGKCLRKEYIKQAFLRDNMPY